MTDRIIKAQAIRRMRRHESETVVLDRIGRRRNQAAPFKEEDRAEFWWLLVGAALAAPTVFALLFAFLLLATPGPAR